MAQAAFLRWGGKWAALGLHCSSFPPQPPALSLSLAAPSAFRTNALVGRWVSLPQHVELLEVSLLLPNGLSCLFFNIPVGVGMQWAETLLLQLKLKTKPSFGSAFRLHLWRCKTRAHPNTPDVFFWKVWKALSDFLFCSPRLKFSF